MAEVKVQPSVRQQRLNAVRERSVPKMLKVLAANETVRRLLKHPSGSSFRSDIGQTSEWPNDGFTRRRIFEGSIYVEGTAKPPEVNNDPRLNARERASSQRPQPRQPVAPNGKKPAPPSGS